MSQLARLRLVAFLAGTATMAVQMLAVRMLAPAVGQAAPVWAIIIAASLTSMAAGYWLGGRIADRHPDARWLGAALSTAAAILVVVAFAGPAVVGHADLGIDSATAASTVGAATGYLLLFAIPAMLLAMTPPFMLRLAIGGLESSGRIVGGLVAISTLGSLIGTVASAVVVIPWIGTRATMLATAATMLVAVALLQTIRRQVEPAVAVAGESGDGGHVMSVADPIVRRASLVAIVAVAGAATMFVELGAARMIAPFYGASQVVWANLIALVMLFLAVGSYVGGRAADRRPTGRGLATVLVSGGIATAILPFVAGPIMRLSTGGIDAQELGTVIGSFVATLLLIAIPIVALGAITPYAVRLDLVGAASSGSRAGSLYAASTAGSIVGTLVAALVFVPEFGTPRTLVVGGGVLALLAVPLAAAHGRERAWWAAPIVVVGVVLVIAAGAPIKPLDDATVLFEGESRYQFVQVVEGDDGRRLLQLNEGWAVHSVHDPDTVETGGVWDHFSLLPALLPRDGSNGDKRGDHELLIIGNAAGTAAVQYREFWPDIAIDGVELDPLVTQVGNRYFDMAGDNLAVHGGDGRPFLARSGDQWDIIHVDAYRQPYIPFYLATREFFQEGHDHLTPGGLLSINVGAAPGDDRIVRAIAATMRDVFPVVVRYRAESYNEIVIAVRDADVTPAELRARVEAGLHPSAESSRLERIGEQFQSTMVEVERDDSLVMTDDHAPVEWLTDRMIAGEARGQAG